MVAAEALLIFQCFLQCSDVVVEDAHAFPGLDDLMISKTTHNRLLSKKNPTEMRVGKVVKLLFFSVSLLPSLMG